MVGPEGGGFVFDTNALHRGDVAGNATRRTVILEFHAHGKVLPLLRHNNPCPSIKAASRAVRTAAPGRWSEGVPGLPLFPTESTGRGAGRGGRAEPDRRGPTGWVR